LSYLTRRELLAAARRLGADCAPGASVDEIIAAIRAATGER
jgi:hypothetical protein